MHTIDGAGGAVPVASVLLMQPRLVSTVISKTIHVSRQSPALPLLRLGGVGHHFVWQVRGQYRAEGITTFNLNGLLIRAALRALRSLAA